jgi:hypothetical protein
LTLGATLKRRIITSMAMVALCLATAPAFGQPTDKAAAEALFKEGRAALETGDYTTACSKFTASLKLSGATGPLVNLAECEEKRGRVATALGLWKDAATRLAGTTDERLARAQERITVLQTRAPRMVVKLPDDAPAGTTIRVDQETVDRPPGQPMTVDPGIHEIVISAPGHESQTMTVALAERELKEITAGPGQKLATTVAVKSEPLPRTAPEPEPSNLKRTIGFVVGGLGVTGLVVGGVTGGIMLDKRGVVDDHCDPETKRCDPEGLEAADSGKSLATVNAIAFAAGVVGVGAGLFLILTSGGQPKAQVSAGALPGGANISLRTSF